MCKFSPRGSVSSLKCPARKNPCQKLYWNLDNLKSFVSRQCCFIIVRPACFERLFLPNWWGPRVSYGFKTNPNFVQRHARPIQTSGYRMPGDRNALAQRFPQTLRQQRISTHEAQKLCFHRSCPGLCSLKDAVMKTYHDIPMVKVSNDFSWGFSLREDELKHPRMHLRNLIRISSTFLDPQIQLGYTFSPQRNSQERHRGEARP